MKRNTLKYAVAATGLIGSVAAVQGQEESSNQLLASLSNVEIGGYVSASYVNVVGSNDGALQQAGAFNSGIPGNGGTYAKDDGFNLDVVGLQFSSPIADEGWQAGYMVDLLVGPEAVGYSSSFNEPSTDDLSVKQAYVNLQAPIGNGIDIKFGHFDTIVGYEVYAPADNTQYTRSYGFASEPFTHTGVLAATSLTDMISVQAGVANSMTGGVSDRAFERDGSSGNLTLLGSVGIDLAGEQFGLFDGASAYFAVVHGSSAGANGGLVAQPLDFVSGDESTHYYASIGMPLPIADTSFAFAWDYRDYDTHVNDGGLVQAGGYTQTFGAYLDYTPAEASWSAHLRGELAESNVGYFTGAAGDEELYAITGTFNFSLFENVLTRIELRYDKDEEGTAFGTIQDPEDDQFMVALNAVYTF